MLQAAAFGRLCIARKGLGRVIHQPYDSCCQMDGTQEVASRLVVTRGDGPLLLEPGKEVLDLSSLGV